MEWRTDDWDPALRFWTLPFDPHLNEWLRATDPSRASILAAREFASQSEHWMYEPNQLLANDWLEDADLTWRPNPPGHSRAAAWNAIKAELEQLQMMMEDDRDRYLWESEAQADGCPDYIIAFIGASWARHPWTIELISCGLAIGNIAYMHYKAKFKRVRPSVLCPGLTPPFGPPAHPAFPSGHSFVGHMVALLLLEIPGICQRHGIFDGTEIGQQIGWGELGGRDPVASPLLWLAQRLAKNRERLGVHYPSDSSASRHLAQGIWDALTHRRNPNLGNHAIQCPTLQRVLASATAEWSTPW